MFVFVCAGYVFVFFKQKTAYEMRISDWSSDVCSSDLGCVPIRRKAAALVTTLILRLSPIYRTSLASNLLPTSLGWIRPGQREISSGTRALDSSDRVTPPKSISVVRGRSEEHTSELQSLMRISYDVFCLKTKTKTI